MGELDNRAMNARWTRGLACIMALYITHPWSCVGRAAETRDAIEKAVRYLSREVESWPHNKKCFSCHNNGDAARVLFLAKSRGFHVEADALDRTKEWLARPDGWVNAAGDTPYKDDKLATVQFAAALLEGTEVNEIQDRGTLATAARLVSEFQEPGGWWIVDPGGLGGSPITYGDHLATAICKRVIQKADLADFGPRAELAKAWLIKSESQRAVDLATVLIGLEGEHDDASAEARYRALRLLAESCHTSGGWGPTRFNRPEPFDTGVVVGALSTVRWEPRVRRMIEDGQEFLLALQNEDGSWPETTRPPHGVSYAHRISTTAWATWGLLKSEREQR